MVNEISPTYYAAGAFERPFTLRGEGFSHLPSDAYGLLSNTNDDPMHWGGVSDAARFTPVHVINDTTMEVNFPYGGLGYDVYLGVIISQDKQTVYWTNNTRPLPVQP